jgi:hypothetical protein
MQDTHTVSLVAVHAEDMNFPLPHVEQLLHTILLVVYLPTLQAVQFISLVAVHTEDTYFPLPHVAQFLHTWLLVVLQADSMYVLPAEQGTHGLQGVFPVVDQVDPVVQRAA